MTYFTALSYNIHKGVSSIRRSNLVEPIATALRGFAPDIIFLQEIVGGRRQAVHWRSQIRRFYSSQTSLAIQPTHSGQTDKTQQSIIAGDTLPSICYGQNADRRTGHHGNATISRFHLKAWRNLNISTNKLEQRGCLHCELVIDTSTGPMVLHTLCVHLNLLARSRMKQLKYLSDYASQEIPPSAPLILAGDFNDWNERATPFLSHALDLKEIFQARYGSHAITFPARLPVLKLDRIYTRHLKVHSAQALNDPQWRNLSDHVPILTTLEVQ